MLCTYIVTEGDGQPEPAGHLEIQYTQEQTQWPRKSGLLHLLMGIVLLLLGKSLTHNICVQCSPAWIFSSRSFCIQLV